MALYSDPVDKLLKLGEIDRFSEWLDYAEMGMRQEDIPELIRMATDADLNFAATTDRGVWAPTHAWRALGQLRAEAAIKPLLDLLAKLDEDDWLREDLPEVMGMIGPAAIPQLAAFLVDSRHDSPARIAASSSLQRIGDEYKAFRDDCVKTLAAQLKKFSETDPELNGFVIADLLDLGAEQTASLMERAFAAGRVDESICGDWETVQIELGLKEASEYDYYFDKEIDTDVPHHSQPASKKAKSKLKNKRKMAKASRRKNRKKKK
jgi:hypothetical protein